MTRAWKGKGMAWIGVAGACALLLAGCGGAPAAPAAPAAPWIAYGDSITAWAADATGAPAVPAFVVAGTPGADSTGAVAKVEAVLDAHPAARGVVLGFGTNDVFRGNQPGPFREMMDVAVDRTLKRQKRALVATIPWSPRPELARVPAFNAELEALRAARGLPAGPDLYAWFRAHPTELSDDGIHPNATGYASIRRLWAEAVQAAGG